MNGNIYDDRGVGIRNETDERQKKNCDTNRTKTRKTKIITKNK